MAAAQLKHAKSKNKLFIKKTAKKLGIRKIGSGIFTAHCSNHFCGVSVPHVPFVHAHGHKISSAHKDTEEEHEREGIFLI